MNKKLGHIIGSWVTAGKLNYMESLTVTLGRNVEDGRLNTIFGVVRFAFICSVAEDPENLARHFSFSSLTRAKGRFLIS